MTMSRPHSGPSNWMIAFIVLSIVTVTIPNVPAAAQQGAGPLTVTGVVSDAQTGEPIAGARITVSNWYQADSSSAERIAAPDHEERGYDRYEVRSDENGSYTIKVFEGQLQLEVDAESYDILSAWTHLSQGRTIDLDLRPAKGDAATLHGVLRSSTGQPIPNANINAWRESRDRCEGDVCIAEGRAAEDAAIEAEESYRSSDEDGVSYNSRPRADNHAWTQTAEDGTWRITIAGGKINVNVWANKHVNEQTTVTVLSGETREVPITLERIPDASVRISGQVVDATSGEPVPYAQVNVQNQRWGTWNWSQTDENGRYEVLTQPGYIIVEASAWQHYWLHECAHKPVPLTAEGDTAEGSPDVASSSIVPRRGCDGEREHAYVSLVFTFVNEANQQVAHDIALERLPAPDAAFQGWVINKTTQLGVPNVQVSFQNQYTREWGTATTDADGSFKIPVRAGFYTIRTHAQHYYDAALNTAIKSGETKTLTIEVTQGPRADGGYCCIAYAESGMAMDESAAIKGTATPGPSAPSMAAGDGDGTAEDAALAARDTSEVSQSTRPDGQQAFEGTGGGLGPYDADKAAAGSDDGPAAGNEAPVAGLLFVALALAAGAMVARRSKR